MNLKEVADAVMAQATVTDHLRTDLKEVADAVMAQATVTDHLRTDLITAQESLLTAYASIKALEEASIAQEALIDALTSEVEALKGSVNGYVEDPEEDETDEQRATRVGIANRVLEIEHLIRGRNRSAPVKRSMTDDDARRVLDGDVRDLGHKEAGAVIGLTYAQVYSARLEYTFKHVHKVLRESGWKNPWVSTKK